MLEAKRVTDHEALYEKYVNPQWVRLLDVLQMNVEYARCVGAELHTTDGRRILDFISGYCVHNVGHNHPRVIAELREELDRSGPAMLQSHVSDLAGELAARLCERAGGRLTRAFFDSSGSEGIETVLKFARAHTGRPGILYAAGGFHGLTCGALSLMTNPFWREGFGPMQALCRRHGTLLVLDEVQTGLYRTGRFLAAHHFGVEPDMVVLAKALSGGLVPCGAVLMSDAVCNSVHSSLRRAVIHTSTYSENSLAMRAGLATLDVLEDGRLGERAASAGEVLRERLAARLAKYEMMGEIRGLGLLSAIEFKAPRRFRLRVPFQTFARIHPAMFGQVVVMRLFRDHGILSQICGNNFMVLKVAPPLVVEDAQLERYVEAIGNIVDLMHSSASFWSEALHLAGRVMTTI